MRSALAVAEEAIKLADAKSGMMDKFEILYEAGEEMISIFEIQKEAQAIMNAVDKLPELDDKFETIYGFMDDLSANGFNRNDL